MVHLHSVVPVLIFLFCQFGCFYLFCNCAISLMSIYVHQWSWRPEFNPRSSHTKDLKMVLDVALLNTRHYKVRIKGKVVQSREWNSYWKGNLPLTLDYGRQQQQATTTYFVINRFIWKCPRGVMVKAVDFRIVVSEFVLQSRYYIHFRANTLGEGMNPLILPAMG